MATAPVSGLLSPSPSMPDLNKAAESSKPQKGEELSNDTNSAKAENAERIPEQPIDDRKDAIVDGGNQEDHDSKIGPVDAVGQMLYVFPGRKAGTKKPVTADTEEPVKSTNKKKKKARPRSRSNSRARSHSRPPTIPIPDYRSGSDSDSSATSFNSRTLEVPARRREYVKAYGAYMKSLEERITDLEKGKPARSRRSSDASSLISTIADVTKIAIPELKMMTWEEYLKDKGKPIPDEFYAIDVLIDEPILYHQRTRKKHSHEGAISGEVNEIPSNAARRSEGLPSRIRINSDMILQHLWRISKKRFAAGKPLYPRTILRPFKVLYLMETEIRELLAELEAKVKAKAEASCDEKSKLPDANGKSESAIASSGKAQGSQEDGEKEGETFSTENLHEEAVNLEVKNEDKAGDELPPEVIKVSEEPSEKAAEEKVEGKAEETTEDKAKTFDERLESEEAINDLRCLIGFIESYLKKVQGEFDRCERQKVRFSELWHLLKPDQLLYVNEKNCPQHIWRAVQATGGRPYLSPWVPLPSGPPPPAAPGHRDLPPAQEPKVAPIAAGYDLVSPFCLDCEYIDYSGVRFGPIFRKFYLDPFDDEMDIKDLTVIPYKYAEKLGLINVKELETRGQKFVQFVEPQHRYYSGKTLTRTPSGALLPQTPEDGYYRPGPLAPVSEETVESEVMIDFDRTFSSNPKWSPRLGEDVIFELMDARECREPPEEGNVEDIDYDMKWDQQIRNDTMAVINLQSARYWSKEEIPTGNDILLLPSRVYAFILRSRKWAALDIDNIRDIKARKNGFEDLELPSGHKDVVQALVQTHFRRTSQKGESTTEENEEQFDLVRDKGKGLIILLHGAPGVGKTSTAECVAESNNVPLLPITCGDLGITAQDVERKLEMNFRLAQAWGCVLLLDEADVFLAQRTSSDLERNAVVSVFLRVLEYYEGILFLTTNRVGAFDEAFKSRIHISLFYPWLNIWQTTRIWEMQMRRIKERLKTVQIDTSQILEYAKLHFETQCRLTGGTGWNGRQIRNAFQSATALAQFECKTPSDPVHLQVRHFEIVAKAAAEFDDYLIRTTGHSDAERAAFNMMRTDSFNPTTSNPMSLENMMQARGYTGAGATQMAFAGGMGGQMPAQAAFGGPMRTNFNTGQQSMPGMNQGSFNMGMGQAMPFPQPGAYGIPAQSSAQAAFMGGAQMGNQQQMWPMQNQGQSSVVGMQQGGMGSMPQQAQQVSGQGQDTIIGQQATGQQPQGGNVQGPQGFNAAAGFQQYPQQGQGYQM